MLREENRLISSTQIDGFLERQLRVQHLRCSSPWVTRNSSILFIAPMKKMILNWDIPMVTRLHRKMGEKTDRRKGMESEREDVLLATPPRSLGVIWMARIYTFFLKESKTGPSDDLLGAGSGPLGSFSKECWRSPFFCFSLSSVAFWSDEAISCIVRILLSEDHKHTQMCQIPLTMLTPHKCSRCADL